MSRLAEQGRHQAWITGAVHSPDKYTHLTNLMRLIVDTLKVGGKKRKRRRRRRRKRKSYSSSSSSNNNDIYFNLCFFLCNTDNKYLL